VWCLWDGGGGGFCWGFVRQLREQKRRREREISDPPKWRSKRGPGRQQIGWSFRQDETSEPGDGFTRAGGTGALDGRRLTSRGGRHRRTVERGKAWNLGYQVPRASPPGGGWRKITEPGGQWGDDGSFGDLRKRKGRNRNFQKDRAP